MQKTRVLAVGAVASVAGLAQASIITYEYTGTVRVGNPWSSTWGQDVKVVFDIDTSVVASSLTENRAEYIGAVVGGYYQFGDVRFDIDPNGSTNSIVVRTDVYDQNFDRFSNRMNINVRAVDDVQGPWQFPGSILLNAIDNDTPRDAIVDLGLMQPLDMLLGATQGGSDGVSLGLGIINGVASTITSGDGAFRVIPAPGATSAIALVGLAAMRRRRG